MRMCMQFARRPPVVHTQSWVGEPCGTNSTSEIQKPDTNVAPYFMSCLQRREDAENAMNKLNGIFLHDVELKIGWGKAVPLPAIPIYAPSESGVLASNASAAATRPAHMQDLIVPKKAYSDDAFLHRVRLSRRKALPFRSYFNSVCVIACTLIWAFLGCTQLPRSVYYSRVLQTVYEMQRAPECASGGQVN